jgi:uncharacterized protein (DUF2336 family)
MGAFSPIVDELEAAVQSRSDGQRVEMLRQVTDLFLGASDHYSDEQVNLFGGVLTQLTQRVEASVLADFSARLAPVGHAPDAVIQQLARHDEISVAGPVLSQSPRLSENDLVEIARTKGQAHLGAISERGQLATVVTDVLVERGNSDVLHKLTSNRGAAFSNRGFGVLARRAEADERLATNLGVRLDLPPQLLQALVAKASEEVQRRLLANAPPASQLIIREALANAMSKVVQEVAPPRDYRRAELLAAKLQDEGQLNEAALVSFAEAGRYEEMVATLARLSGAPVDLIARLMQNPRYDGVLVVCKAADLYWPALGAILKARFSPAPGAQELDQARVDFIKLSAATAKRMFRFWLVRGLAKTVSPSLAPALNAHAEAPSGVPNGAV